jgi:carboxypeptidase C (cathepsin A)
MRAPTLLLALCLASVALADDADEPLTETRHSVTIGDASIAYIATAGRLTVRDWDGKPKAKVFFISYTREREETADPSERPITFAFNGGPGSSSVWLHLGALGPRRVALGDEGEAVPPPYRLVDNEASWLDLTDLVFIDPVSTGYSRAVEGEDPKQFHGLDEDTGWVAEFIRLYVTRFRRWSSPKFLAGESYGTTRAAALAGHLQDELGLYVNGVVLVSPVLSFGTIRFDPGNDEPYWLFLPTYTAAAWYHERLEPALQQQGLARTLAEAQDFAQGDYVRALARGSDLPEAETDALARRVARYTGLTPQWVKNARLRVNAGLFMKELLREQGRTIGRYDARYVGDDPTDVGQSPSYDPSYTAVQGAYTGAFNDYVRRALRYENDGRYEILTGRVHPWTFPANNAYVNVGDRLRDALTRNPGLRVLVCSGYYDLATPYFAADYTVSHLGLDAERRARVTQAYYEAGHMMYLRRADLLKLKQDAAQFYGAR